jgi:hypothetical protein
MCSRRPLLTAGHTRAEVSLLNGWDVGHCSRVVNKMKCRSRYIFESVVAILSSFSWSEKRQAGQTLGFESSIQLPVNWGQWSLR